MKTLTLPRNLPIRNPAELEPSIYRDDFALFVQRFWPCVPGAGQLIWNWYIDVFCSELERLAEGVFQNRTREYDLVFNQPFGTSKSTVVSILFPAWVWTRMPSARFLCATYTDKLVLDLSTKCRDVILSEAERMAEIVRKIGRITRYETKAYVGSTQILDLDKSTTDG